MGCILGIDQGGTKTCAAVMDQKGNILSYSRTGGCYFPSAGIGEAARFMFSAAENAMKDANIEISDIDIIASGVTGIDWDGDDALVTGALKERFGNKEIIACNDCEIAYYSGTLNPVGAVICAGTGINAALFAPGGKKFVMGDYLKSSVQGGSAIATRAIEAVFGADLGMLPETGLTKLFLDFSGDGVVFKLLQRYKTSRTFSTEIISLVPQIIDVADGGDKVAQAILTEFSDELCSCYIAAMKKMDMLELDCDIVLAGSVFMGRTNGLTVMVAKRILRHANNANIINAAYEPVVGACILGMIKKTGNFDENMARNATASAKRLSLLRTSPEIL